MLVLSRKLNEKIQIGDNITITLIRVEGGKVRLGIDAPRDIRVLRAELEAIDPASLDPASLDPASLDPASREDDRDSESELSQISDREGAFAHPVAMPSRSVKKSKVVEGVNRLNNLTSPHLYSARIRVNDSAKPQAGAPLAGFLR
ncbi:hypothetical protein CA13_67240 [Planctomycetes bacterium CA13]|uniref:Translational regulator CsrA n=1 Tax=Novipirellula herctigrandis TaxID=2527986 RepID=A0A5C5YMS9_9BACT|nr:hypothetical protein CA13_67240 [Planctomycetes bacterium CA13]